MAIFLPIPMKSSLAFAAAALIAAPLTVLANGTRLPVPDSFVVARGYADVATADRPSAVYYNPAGLAQLPAAEATLGAQAIRPKASVVTPTGNEISQKTQTFGLPYAFFSAPVMPLAGQEVTVGAGFYTPFGLSSEWPDNSGFRTVATDNTVHYYTTALSLAVPVAPGLSIGGNLEYDAQHVDLNRGLGYYPTDRFHFAGHGHAWSYDLGLLWRLAPEHAIGINFHSKTNFGIRGTVNLDPFQIAYSGHLDWAYPEDFSIGYSYRPAPDWNFEADWDWTNWHRLQTVVLYSSAMAPEPLPFDWKASSYFSFGGTHYWRGGWNASAGVQFSQNSSPAATFNPAVPDTDRVLLNAGAGYAVGAWDFQASLQAAPQAHRTITGSPMSPAGQTADGRYTTEFIAIGLDATYRL